MNSQTAYFHVQVSSPSHDAREVLELLKAQERVVFNEVNEVFTYIVSRPTLLTMRCTPHANLKPFIFHNPFFQLTVYHLAPLPPPLPPLVTPRSSISSPYPSPFPLPPSPPCGGVQPDLTISTEPQLRTFIRSNSTPLSGIPVKTLREAMPPASISMLEDLERRGDVLIMRALTGNFRDAPLPKLGRENGLGLRINDGASSGNGRWKTVWWDEVRERGRAGKRVDDGGSVHLGLFSWRMEG